MTDADQQQQDQQDEEQLLDLDVPEDEARSVEGGTVSNIMKTAHDSAKNALNNVR